MSDEIIGDMKEEFRTGWKKELLQENRYTGLDELRACFHVCFQPL